MTNNLQGAESYKKLRDVMFEHPSFSQLIKLKRLFDKFYFAW